AARGDVDELRHDKQIGIPQEFADLAGKQTVLAAEIKSEIDVLDDVTDGVDADHGQQQPRGSEGSRIADVKDHNRCENGQPDGNNHPINQCGYGTHDWSGVSLSASLAITRRLRPGRWSDLPTLRFNDSAVRGKKALVRAPVGHTPPRITFQRSQTRAGRNLYSAGIVERWRRQNRGSAPGQELIGR